MLKLKVKTNVPALNIVIWNGFNQQVVDKTLSADPICQFCPDGTDDIEKLEECVLELPKGIYTVRLNLPYYSDGRRFMMPVVMNKILVLNKNKTFTFKGGIEINEEL